MQLLVDGAGTGHTAQKSDPDKARGLRAVRPFIAAAVVRPET